jgi:Asp-tRNA(Asn)/Glu-tRNA(Gln) amidotransferase A subunit family amidase
MTDTPAVGSRILPSDDEGGGLTSLSARRIAERIRTREASSVQVVRHFLDRIEQHDPELHAFRRLDPTGALAQAERADQTVRAGDALGPLHGVPIAVKELFVVEGFPLPGSYASYLEDRSPEPPLATRDDVEVERLRAAGAVLVGVTVAAVGPTPGMADPMLLPRNPWNTAHTSGSSSAGNGAAVGAGLIPLAIGDDGGGSIRVPAAFCGLVGLSPTRGLVPHVDYRSVAPRATVTVGPMARAAEDAALALQVLAGPDGRDYVGLQDDPPDYLDRLDAGIAGRRFLWSEHFGSPPLTGTLRAPQVVAAIRAAAARLESVGASVEDSDVGWEDPQPLWMATQRLIGPEMAAYSDDVFTEADMVEALAGRDRNWRRFRTIFAEHDFVVSPTVQITAPAMADWIELTTRPGDDPKRMDFLDVAASHTMLCNVLGLPAITIPAGFEDGLPIGLHVIGRPGGERELLQVAQAFPAGRGARGV